MTIPSIEMKTTGVVESAATNGTSGPGLAPASFSSFLEDNSAMNISPRSMLGQGLVQTGNTPPADAASGERGSSSPSAVPDAAESVMPDPTGSRVAATGVSVRRTQTDRGSDGFLDGSIGESSDNLAKKTKFTVIAKAKMLGPEVKKAEKRVSSGEIAGVSPQVESPLQTVAATPTSAIATAPVVASLSKQGVEAQGERGSYVAWQGNLSGQGLSVAMDKAVSIATVTLVAGGPDDLNVSDGLVDMVSPGHTVVASRDKETAVAEDSGLSMPPALMPPISLHQAPPAAATQVQLPANVLLQSRANVLKTTSDITVAPATPSVTSTGFTKVSDPSPDAVTQRLFHAASETSGERLPANLDHGPGLTATDQNATSAGIVALKNGSRSDSGTSHTPFYASSNPMGRGSLVADTSDPIPFGPSLFGYVLPKTAEGISQDDVRNMSTLSASGQFAMERIQVAGATRALGDALQSSVGIGVQTESFGHVTIRTTTEGSHLLAQVILENGSQSATLVSHVPAVEHTLSQQSGLRVAVNVLTGSQSSSSAGTHSGGEEPQQHRRLAEPKVPGAETSVGTDLQAGEIRVSALWSQRESSGRLDVTV